MTHASPNTLSAWETAALIERGELRPSDLMRACLDRIAERDGDVHAFVHLDPDAAMRRARILDAAPRKGLLHGLPLGVKDLMDTADFPTEYGSDLYKEHRPHSDAAVVALCRREGAVVAGKTVTTEFAYFHPGPTRNPHNLGHTPGGSSSGSAAAVADLMVPLALGTQTAGSIIRPAAYCGIVGYKPTWGRVPRAGIKSLSETLDTVGGFARTVRDVALLGAVLTGDTRLNGEFQPVRPRIGLCPTSEWAHVSSDVQRAWAEAVHVLAPQAAYVSDAVLPPDLPDLVALQKAIMAFEMSRALAYELSTNKARLSAALQELLVNGTKISGATHLQNQRATASAQARVDSLFDDFDVLLTPSAAGEAPPGIDATGDPLFCRTWTLLGLPCVHIPFARGSQNLPVGLQLVGRWGDDHKLLAIAEWISERIAA
ncbi:amidase [Paraburkholderia fungorum]|jgi:Asp-tRNA(Asn)/Glu-tRNA(Gln) amidotransferase A subunit family amidase|uniref:amidase n=1 Tax=Paraburkholderia fungorum TaxID=134537 RepID=UPI0038BB556D